MTSEHLRKMRVAGASAETFAALSVLAGVKREPATGDIKDGDGGSEIITRLKRIDPG